MTSRTLLLLRPTRPPHSSHGKYSAAVPPKAMDAPRVLAFGLMDAAAFPVMTGTLPRATSATVVAMRSRALFSSLGSSASMRRKALDSSRIPRTSTLTLSATVLHLGGLEGQLVLGVTPHVVRPPLVVLADAHAVPHLLDGHAQRLGQREGE